MAQRRGTRRLERTGGGRILGRTGSYEGPAFTGSAVWVGEFGWLAAVAMLVLGVATAAWHPDRGGRAA